MTDVSLQTLRPSSSSGWFARRISRLLAGGPSVIEEPLIWLHHQWLQGHSCLDLSGTVLADVASNDPAAQRVQARAKLPASWGDELAALAFVDTRPSGSLDPSDRLLVLEGSRLFLAACRHDEIVVASTLRRLATEPSRWASQAPASVLDTRVRSLLPEADALQVAASRLPFANRLGIVTGGPGTGKTTIAGCMIDAALQLEPRAIVRALAPTGKAAARMTQSLRAMAGRPGLGERTRETLQRVEVSTIHHALLAGGGRSLQGAHLVIVDECSMIDLSLMRRLLEGLGPSASLVLLGDPDQLASVEAGTLLQDILPDGPSHPLAYCTVALQRSRRFESGGALAALAAAVRESAVERAIAALDSEGALRWIRVRDPASAVAAAVQAQSAFVGNGRVLCGHRRGQDGSLAVNRAITRALHPGADADPESARDFLGRPVMITANDPVTGLRNGDTGTVERHGAGLAVRFADLDRTIPVEGLPARETAWALSIHKSQGSEYDQVAIVLPVQASPVLTRELLYTGITRSRGAVTIIASESSLRASIEQRIERASGLRARLARA
jgi:exodeoxyribonuclease V alpha subunit